MAFSEFGDSMYAVIRTGGKQHRVAANDHVTVERLAGEPGTMVALGDVLMIDGGDQPLIGTDVPASACVFAEIVAQTRGDKIIIFKRKRRKHYQRRTGHRQDLTVLRIAGISLDGVPAAIDAAAEAPAPADAEPVPAAVDSAPTADPVPAEATVAEPALAPATDSDAAAPETSKE